MPPEGGGSAGPFDMALASDRPCRVYRGAVCGFRTTLSERRVTIDTNSISTIHGIPRINSGVIRRHLSDPLILPIPRHEELCGAKYLLPWQSVAG